MIACDVRSDFHWLFGKRMKVKSSSAQAYLDLIASLFPGAAPEQKGEVDPSMQSAKALHGGTTSKPPRTPDGKLMTTNGKQLLHFVFGGELKDLSGTEFRDLSKLDIVGIFPDYASAARAWKAKAQATVDNAHMRYFVAHLHRLLDPSKDKT
jgi:uncharacterized protein DUF4170